MANGMRKYSWFKARFSYWWMAYRNTYTFKWKRLFVAIILRFKNDTDSNVVILYEGCKRLSLGDIKALYERSGVWGTSWRQPGTIERL